MSIITFAIDRRLIRTAALTGQLRRSSRRLGAAAPVVHGLDFLARGVLHVWQNRRYLTFLKLLNMGAVNVQFALKTERVLGRPYKMKIEPTNICNTHCQLCPTGLKLPGRPKGRMTLAQFRGLIDQLHRFLFTVDLSMWGDPLIVPEIFDMIRYAHGRRVWTYISSNFHAFKAEKGHARALVESGLDVLTVSLHGASQETFAVYQPGKSLGDTLAKVRDLLAERARLGSTTPQVQLNFVVTRFNEHELAAFQALADELGCRAIFSQPSLNLRLMGRDSQGQPLGLAPDLLERQQREQMDKWLPSDRRFVLSAYQRLRAGTYSPEDYNGSKLYNCSWPWRSSVINWDGTVVTCCGSWDTKEDMGNVLEQPFGKIWNSRRYRMARRSFRHKVAAQDAADNPCAGCPGFML
jgi:radical SAM protein with 4Fe4S-binding SPASM domain